MYSLGCSYIFKCCLSYPIFFLFWIFYKMQNFFCTRWNSRIKTYFSRKFISFVYKRASCPPIPTSWIYSVCFPITAVWSQNVHHPTSSPPPPSDIYTQPSVNNTIKEYVLQTLWVEFKHKRQNKNDVTPQLGGGWVSVGGYKLSFFGWGGRVWCWPDQFQELKTKEKRPFVNSS